MGQQLVKVFSPDYDMIAWDRGEIDITDRDLIIKKVSELKPSIIVNAAAYNAVDKCEESEAEYDLAKRINIDGPKFLAEACLSIGSTLIHYSTDYVFNGEKKSGYEENDEPKPINRYGKSKFHGEKRVLELSGRGLKWYLIRTSKLFGPKSLCDACKPSFFELMLKRSENMGKIINNKTASGGVVTPGAEQAIEVVNDEVSCFTYTPDLAQATKNLVQSDKGYGIYHLTNSGACTWYQAAVELFEAAKINLKVIPISSEKLARPAKRPKYSILLNTKLTPLRDYRDALREHLT